MKLGYGVKYCSSNERGDFKFGLSNFVMSFLKFAVVFICASWAATALAGGPLVWQSPSQTNSATPDDVTTQFVFKVRNVSTTEVVIDDLKPSCGCTVAQLPSQPWRIGPKEAGQFAALVDLRGRRGQLFKEIKVISSNAPETLKLEIDIQPGPQNLTPQMQYRIWGQKLAATDHQTVFKKDCVGCHLVPAFGKSGEPLFHTTCGICHEAEHRATMVPDLAALKTEIDTNYWRDWVTHGKAGTLMPGFTATEGGPLDDAQIDSLVKYLTKAFSRPLKAAATNSTTANN